MILMDLEKEAYNNYNAYTDKDLENATIIFMHLLMDKMYENHKFSASGVAYSQPQLLELSSQAGAALRKLIMMYTGKDMHAIVKLPE